MAMACHVRRALHDATSLPSRSLVWQAVERAPLRRKAQQAVLLRQGQELPTEAVVAQKGSACVPALAEGRQDAHLIVKHDLRDGDDSASIDSRPAVDEDRASAGARGVNVRRCSREVLKHVVLLLVLGSQHEVLDVSVLGIHSVLGHIEHVCNTERLQLLHALRGLQVAEIEVV